MGFSKLISKFYVKVAALLTQGSIPFADADGKLEKDSVNFIWDNVNKRLGIGTNTPAQTFDLVGNFLTLGQNILGGGTYPRYDNLYNLGNSAYRWKQGYFSARVEIGDIAPEASAILQANSVTKGFLPPRMTTVQRDAITPATGLLIYNTTTNQWEGYNGTSWVILG